MLTTLWSGEGECFSFEAGVLGRSSDLAGVSNGFVLVGFVFLVSFEFPFLHVFLSWCTVYLA